MRQFVISAAVRYICGSSLYLWQFACLWVAILGSPETSARSNQVIRSFIRKLPCAGRDEFREDTGKRGKMDYPYMPLQRLKNEKHREADFLIWSFPVAHFYNFSKSHVSKPKQRVFPCAAQAHQKKQGRQASHSKGYFPVLLKLIERNRAGNRVAVKGISLCWSN